MSGFSDAGRPDPALLHAAVTRAAAVDPDGVEDPARLTRLLDAAVRAGTVAPADLSGSEETLMAVVYRVLREGNP